jgi:oligopeptidase A
MSRILTLRKEKAALLGYCSYAELSVSQKMAKTVGQVQRLLDELHVAAGPAAKREIEELAVFAKSRG